MTDADGVSDPVLAIQSVGASLAGSTFVLQAAVLDSVAVGGVAVSSGLLIGIGPLASPRPFEPSLLTTDQAATAVATADFNKDGREDLVSAETHVLRVFEGLDGGVFEERSTLGALQVDFDLLEVTDLDRDGDADIIGITSGGDVYVALGTGSWAFSTFDVYPDIATTVLDSCLGDFDRDGAPDLACTDFTNNEVVVLMGKGDGTFHPPVASSAWQQALSLTAGRFDSDPLPDLVVLSNSGMVRFMSGQGDGTFVDSGGFDNSDAFSGRVRSGDLDGDGHRDLVTSLPFIDSIEVRLGASNGSFGTPMIVQTSEGPRWIDIVDLDFDGGREVVVQCASGSLDIVPMVGGALGTPLQVLIGPELNSAAFGDFDDDGIRDFAVAKRPGIQVHRSNGAYPPSGMIAFDVGDGVSTAATGDFDEDGWIDLIVANELTDELSLIHRPGAPLPTTVSILSVGDRPSIVGVDDLDRDGDLDLVALLMNEQKVQAYMGDGNGGLAPGWSYVMPGASISALMFDANRDGFVDLVTADNATDHLRIHLGDGSGGFVLHASVGSCTLPRALEAADLDGDGFGDLVVKCIAGNELEIYLGDGTGSFSLASTLDLGSSVFLSRALDFDEDGLMDLVSFVGSGQRILVSPGLGAGNFGPSIEAAAGLEFVSDIADLDLDGRPDLLWSGVRSNDGIGGFGGSQDFGYWAIGSANRLALDFDGNGVLDVIEFSNGGDHVILHPNLSINR